MGHPTGGERFVASVKTAHPSESEKVPEQASRRVEKARPLNLHFFAPVGAIIFIPPPKLLIASLALPLNLIIIIINLLALIHSHPVGHPRPCVGQGRRHHEGGGGGTGVVGGRGWRVRDVVRGWG